MASEFSDDNLKYTSNLIRPSTTKGTVMTNNGTDNFELVTPSSDGQILTSDASVSAGSKWSAAAQGLGVGFGIGNGTTPNVGGTIYFLTLASAVYIPGIPIPNGTIIFFSVRPDSGPLGWSNAQANISGGTLDYTFGYIDSTDNPTIANFNAYSGGPHYQIAGTAIGSGGNNFASFFASLNIPVIVTGQQIAVQLQNNLTLSGPEPTDWTEQNAFLILRF